MFAFVWFLTKNVINLYGNNRHKTNLVRFLCIFFAKIVANVGIII